MYIDTHLDTVWHVNISKRKFTKYEGKKEEKEKIAFGPGIFMDKHGHVDLPRARKGELLLGFFTGFPSSNQYSTEKMVRDWLLFMNNPQHQIQRIKTLKELNNFIEEWKKTPTQQRRIGAIFSLEGAAGIDTELNRLYILHDIGLRSIGLTWNEQNQFATGVLGDKDRGLTTEGKNLVYAAQDLGIILDVSHLNDKSFWDLIDASSTPVIASHSNYREKADHPRNLNKEMLQAIRDTEGSIGLNLHNGFLLPKSPKNADITTAIEMIEAMIEVVGINHVHIGSDFDGSNPPKGIEDISCMPVFFEKIAEKLSLSNKEIEKIQYQNILRIIKKVWKK